MTTSLCHESFCVYIRKENFINERQGYSIKDTGILEKKRAPTARTYDLPISSLDSFRARFGKLFFEVQDVIFLQAFEKKTELEKIRERNQKLVNNILPEHVADYFLQHQNKDETVGWMLRHFHICEYYGLSLKPNHGVGFAWLAKKTRETLPLAPSHLVLVFHWLKTHGGNCVKTKLDFVRFMDKFYMICWKNPKRLSFTQSSHELEWNWALNSKHFNSNERKSSWNLSVAWHISFVLRDRTCTASHTSTWRSCLLRFQTLTSFTLKIKSTMAERNALGSWTRS